MGEMSDLLGSNLAVHNSKGEVIFSMKRKDKYPPPYYIFEKHEGRMTDEEKENFKEPWSLIKAAAARMGFPLYDMREISDGVEAQIKAVMETDEFKEATKKVDEVDGDDLMFVKDIKFKVFDHAKGTINTLTVGVNVKDMTK